MRTQIEIECETIPEPAALLPAVSLSNPPLGFGAVILRKRI